jgi:hypothetical protein
MADATEAAAAGANGGTIANGVAKSPVSNFRAAAGRAAPTQDPANLSRHRRLYAENIEYRERKKEASRRRYYRMKEHVRSLEATVAVQPDLPTFRRLVCAMLLEFQGHRMDAADEDEVLPYPELWDHVNTERFATLVREDGTITEEECILLYLKLDPHSDNRMEE